MNNGAWHTVRCVRTATSVTMYVDGKQTSRSARRTGNVNNTMPWTVGGKPNCNGSTVDCDYFAGDVDYVRLTKG
jgi:concanavalin A-like lectin/glucanase superfamily protein